MKKVEDFLNELGFSDIEAKIYDTLIENGPKTVKEISDLMGMNRVTIHYHVETLIKKGVITETRSGARRQLIAENPDRLEYLIEQKVENAIKLREKLPDLLNTINAARPQAEGTNMEVKYYKGKLGVKQIYEEVLKAKEIRAYVNAKEVAKVFVENMENFINAHNKREDMHIWEIMNKSEDVENYASAMARGRYLYKFIPETMNLSVIDCMIYDGKVAVVTIKEDAKGLVVENEEYYENAKAIFDFVWQMLPEPKTSNKKAKI